MKLPTTKQVITDLSELDKIGRAEEIDITKENNLMREIIANIKRTMRKNGLVSLSAPAIGYNKRIFCLDFSDKEIKTFINPLVTNVSGIELTREVCSSIPGKEFIRPRNSTIDLIYTTPLGQIKSNSFKGVAAHVIQHELDHLEGITLSDIGLEVEPDFDEATDDERFEIINMYLDSLDIKRKTISEEIQEDPELNTISERLRFTEALARGDIKLEKLD